MAEPGNDAEVWLALKAGGNALFKAGSHAEALEAYADAIDALPAGGTGTARDLAILRNNRATCLATLARAQPHAEAKRLRRKAAAECGLAIASDATFPKPWLRRGMLALEGIAASFAADPREPASYVGARTQALRDLLTGCSHAPAPADVGEAVARLRAQLLTARFTRLPAVTGPRPQSVFQSSVAHAGSVFVIGGTLFDPSKGFAAPVDKHLHRFDVARRRWSVVETHAGQRGLRPTFKSNASAVLHRGRLILYGGADTPQPTRVTLDPLVWALDLGTFAWSRLDGPPPRKKGGAGARVKPLQPCPRIEHAAVVVGDEMIICGGEELTRFGFGRRKSVVDPGTYQFNLVTHVWTRLASWVHPDRGAVLQLAAFSDGDAALCIGGSHLPDGQPNPTHFNTTVRVGGGGDGGDGGAGCYQPVHFAAPQDGLLPRGEHTVASDTTSSGAPRVLMLGGYMDMAAPNFVKEHGREYAKHMDGRTTGSPYHRDL